MPPSRFEHLPAPRSALSVEQKLFLSAGYAFVEMCVTMQEERLATRVVEVLRDHEITKTHCTSTAMGE